MKHPKRFIEIIEHIKAHPESWDQADWHSTCGTKHCIAGWTQIKAGKEPNWLEAASDASDYLGLTEYESQYLFASCRNMHDFDQVVDGLRAGERFIYDGEDADGIGQSDLIRVEVRGGVAYCDDPRVTIIDHDNQEEDADE